MGIRQVAQNPSNESIPRLYDIDRSISILLVLRLGTFSDEMV